ncbi:DUF485 domain-containing protein [Allorhodopirellula solitaria]|uniref:DUF485 domain-containing protein n=1 Tax=Allorhodopirellula solitaria TaxID=2527987 RepID=UPI001FE941DB|nr:DUF485 domain-containing protein [Allorhodopirellula solitaria]
MTEPVNAPAAPSSVSPLGLTLFVIYTLLYLGFVLLNAFATETMDMVVVAGLNLAIVYGFGLIIAAIVMAFIYGFALRGDTGSHPAADDKGESA